MKVLNDLFILLIFVLIPFLCQECPEFCLCEVGSGNCIGCIDGHYNLTSNCNELCDKCPDKKCYDNGIALMKTIIAKKIKLKELNVKHFALKMDWTIVKNAKEMEHA